MKINVKQKAKTELLRYLSEVPSATRQEVLDGAMSAYTPGGQLDALKNSDRYGTVRSYLGATLSELVRTGEVRRGGRGYTLAYGMEVVVLRSEVERKIRATLKRHGATKESLVRSISRIIGTDTTSTAVDDQLLADTVKSLLREMCERGDVILEGDLYSWRAPVSTQVQSMDFEAFRNCFFEFLSEQGGPAFEVYVAGLLEKFYMMRGTEVLFSETTGGSTDGGIDVELHTKDALGFLDRVLIQTKCRIKGHVTEKEVREFYGAMCAKHGSRGLYVTTSNFHPSAVKFLNSIDRIIGIDGEALLRIALETSYGIRKSREGYRIDTQIFGR